MTNRELILATLPADIAEKAIANAVAQKYDDILDEPFVNYHDYSSPIAQTFIFDATPEGQAYWNNIKNEYFIKKGANND